VKWDIYFRHRSLFLSRVYDTFQCQQRSHKHHVPPFFSPDESRQNRTTYRPIHTWEREYTKILPALILMCEKTTYPLCICSSRQREKDPTCFYKYNTAGPHNIRYSVVNRLDNGFSSLILVELLTSKKQK
jgi:hypothetical protein